MHTADDDSVPVPTDALNLPRPVLMRAAVWRPQRDQIEPEDTDVTSVDALSGSLSSSRTASDDLDDEPTRAIQVYVPPKPQPRTLPTAPQQPDAVQDLLARATAHLDSALARAAQLWRDGPLRTAAMVAGAALLTYLAVGGMRRDGESRTQTVLVPVAAVPVAAPIIVEQLSGTRQPSEAVAAPLYAEQSDRSARRSGSGRAHGTSFTTPPASKNLGYQIIAPAQSKPRSRAERSSTAVSSSSAGLPAWGSETVRDFSGGKSGAGASEGRSQALTAKPSPSNVEARGSAREQDTSIPPPMGAYRSSAREQAPVAPVVAPKPAPVVAAKAIEPPKPVEPPKPSKPLTMDQVLNQVEEAAQAQRKKEGLKAPKASKRDEELDALISGAMKSKK